MLCIWQSAELGQNQMEWLQLPIAYSIYLKLDKRLPVFAYEVLFLHIICAIRIY